MVRLCLLALAVTTAIPVAAQISLKIEPAVVGVAGAVTLKLDEKSFLAPGPFSGSYCSWSLDLGDGRKRRLDPENDQPHGYEFEVQYARSGTFRIVASPDQDKCHHKESVSAQVNVTKDYSALALELFASQSFVDKSTNGVVKLRDRSHQLTLLDTEMLESALSTLGPDGRLAVESIFSELAKRAGTEAVNVRWRKDIYIPGNEQLLVVQHWQREYRLWRSWLDQDPVSLGIVTFDQIRQTAAALSARRTAMENGRLEGLRRQVQALKEAEGSWAAVRLAIIDGVWCGVDMKDSREWTPTYLNSAPLIAWAKLSKTPRLHWVKAPSTGGPANPLIDQSCGITVGPAPEIAEWILRAGVEHSGLNILAPTSEAVMVSERSARDGFTDVASWRWSRELGEGTSAKDLENLREAGLLDTAAVDRVRERLIKTGYGNDKSVRSVLAFLSDERNGRSKGISALAFRQQVDAAVAERDRLKNEARLREFPWTAEFQCVYNGSDLGVLQCLLGTRSNEGWINVVNGADQRIYQPADITLGMGRLHLRSQFRLSALNPSDFVLKVVLRDARTGKVIAERAAPPRSKLVLVP